MPISESNFLNQLQNIDSAKFEQLVAELWEMQGWETFVTSDGSDGGIDVIAEKTNPIKKKEVIQVKRYDESNPVGRPDIQQYASLRQEETDVDTVVVVTSSRFTDGAEEVASKLNVKLVNGFRLYNLIEALSAFDLALSYVSKGPSSRSITEKTQISGEKKK